MWNCKETDCDQNPKKRMIERSDVVEAPVPSASTWSVTSPAAQAKSSSLLLSEDIKPTNKKRRLNEDIVEKAGARGFQDLPPEIVGKIMSYLETTDKKKMRCVSKWCFYVVSTASKELKALFGTYSLKRIGRKNYCEISKVLTRAVERVPSVKLNLQFDYDFTDLEYDENGEEMERDDELVTSKQLEEMLTSYNNIISLRISLSDEGECDNTKLLLQPHLDLSGLKRLHLEFTKTDLQKNICEAILARYGDKLEHLGVMDLEIPDNSILQVPRLPKLQSLSIQCSSSEKVDDIVHTFVNAVNKENITHLSIRSLTIDIGNLDNLIFPKLKYLEFMGIDCDEAALSLIKCHKDTITKLILDHVFVHNLHFDIGIPHLQSLELSGISTESSLSLIEKNKDTLVELRLKGDSMFVRDSDSFPVVEMPRLKRLYLMQYDYNEKLNRINAFGRNITELWLFDFYSYLKGDKYIKQSTRRLNKLKIKAKRLNNIDLQ